MQEKKAKKLNTKRSIIYNGNEVEETYYIYGGRD